MQCEHSLIKSDQKRLVHKMIPKLVKDLELTHTLGTLTALWLGWITFCRLITCSWNVLRVQKQTRHWGYWCEISRINPITKKNQNQSWSEKVSNSQTARSSFLIWYFNRKHMSMRLCILILSTIYIHIHVVLLVIAGIYNLQLKALFSLI